MNAPPALPLEKAGRTCAAPVSEPGGRLLALDVFRGATIAFMILVNNQGSSSAGYGPLLHGKAYALTPTDWVFPFFLFIVGVAMPFSFARRLGAGGDAGRSLLWQILRRSANLFAIGMLLNLYPKFDFGTWRVLGVLQRIAICYLAVSLITLHCGKRGQIAWLAGLLLGYWALMALVPFPGRTDNPWSLPFGTNLSDYIDRTLLRPFLFRPNIGELKGLLSTLPAIGTTLLGYWAGRALMANRPGFERTTLLSVGGTLLLVVGLFWEFWVPFSQRLWTPSYTVYTAGLAVLILAACYWWIDLRGRQRGLHFFIVFGRNAILAWCGSQLLAKTLSLIQIEIGGKAVSLREAVFDHGLATLLNPANASLLYGLMHVAIWWAVLVYFQRRKWYWRV